MVVRLFAPDYDSLLNKRGQFASCSRARTDIPQKELFQREWLAPFLRISNLDDDIEIEDGLEER